MSRLVKWNLTGLLLSLFFVQSFCIKSAAPFGIGPCPKYSSMRNFDINQILGRWHEVERTFFYLELGLKCTVFELQEKNKRTYNLRISSVYKITGQRTSSLGTVVVSKKDLATVIFRINSKLPKALAKLIPGSGAYQILDTDYNNYLILDMCTSYFLGHSEMLWVFGRTENFSANVRHTVYKKLNELGFDTERLVLSSNNRCPTD